MKTLATLVLTILVACNSMHGDSTRSFIPGTYVKHFDDEYFKDGEDTLIISNADEGGNVYPIARHMSYQKVIDKKVQPRENKSEKWMGVYNEQEKVLHEQKHGAIISFDPNNKLLRVGNNEYKKVK